MRWKPQWNRPIASVLAAAVLSAQMLTGGILGTGMAATAEAAPSDTQIKLRLMSTTDVHTNVYGWDYFKNAPSVTVGLDRTATLVTYAREENPNNLLLDNGDLIQGTPLGTYMVKESGLMTTPEKIHPMMAAMNVMKYDVATYGNHEFNYGLEFLTRTVKGSTGNPNDTDANFPYVNANIYNVSDGKNTFTPYVILDKKVKDTSGIEQTIKVGFLGLVPPQIMDWDKDNLEGKVITKGITETAQKFVPIMQQEGADVIVAMAHTGFDANATGDHAENDINALSKVVGIDAITFSHTHQVFPTTGTLDKSFIDPATTQPYNSSVSVVDNVYGRINGTPAVQAGYGGAYLGLIDLSIVPDPDRSGHWKVDKQSSVASTRSIANAKPDPNVDAVIKADHEATKTYTGQELGQTSAAMNSYFALVQDDPTIQIVTNAQKWFVEKNLPEKYKGLPILSVGAPFKAGGNDPKNYTEIPQGELTIRSASDLYLYDNTLKAIKIKGSVVKNWLEMSAGAFNQIDPNLSTAPQPLLNPDFKTYNFDVIDGIKYKIDVTKKAKYKTDGTINDDASSRVTDLKYNNRPLDLNQDFIVITNNYRAGGGGNFPGVKGSEMVLDTQTENRQVLMDYISEMKTINPTADGNWSLAPIKGNVNVTFMTTPLAAEVVPAPANITYTKELNPKGFGIFKLDLPARDVEVHLLGINDFHGQLDTISIVTKDGKPASAGTAAILAAYLKEALAKYDNTLLFHNGDSVGASAPVSSLERDEPTHEWMNLMKFDVGSLGNHEFDQGVAALMTQLKGGADPKDPRVIHAGSKFDYVNANAIDIKTNEPIINPYVIKELGGVKIGFIGLVTKATPNKVSPAGTAGVRFLSADEEVKAVNKYAQELQSKGVETIIVLAHDPASTNRTTSKPEGEAVDLANALPVSSPVDVIVAGDNHALANFEVNGKLIVQAFSYGTAFEDITLVIDPMTGDVKTKTAAITTTFHEGKTPDADTVALVNKYLALHPELTKPVGTTDGTITRTDAYNNEAALGNLIADAMRGADFGDGKGAADFAFMNPGGIRADLPKGDVTFGDLAKIQPFGNTLVKLTLTGAQIKTLLQQQWNVKADGTADTKTLQISGLKYTAYMGLPAAERITSLTLANGTPIDMSKSYTAVVNNFMAAGGDNYKILTEASDSIAGPIDLDVFYAYVVKTFNYGEIKAAIEGRIKNNAGVPTTTNPTPPPSGPSATVTPAPKPSPTATPSTAPSATPAPTVKPAPTATPIPVPAFKDLGNVAWAKEAIETLAAKGIIKGLDGNNFAPKKNVSRAEFITMLVRALNLTDSGAGSKFSDVKQGVWYTDAIAIAVNAGIVKGSGNGKFEPGREITREEMAIMIANALKKQKVQLDSNSAALSKFEDKSKIASYAQEAVAQLTNAGIISGMDAKTFVPKGIANRAQAAVIINRMLQQAS